MRFGKVKEREKAFVMRTEGMTFAKIAKELGVSAKTVSRWENGWKDGAGRKREGWKKRLEEAWQERLDSELNYGLMVKELRLRMQEQLARMLIARLKEAIPSIKIPNAAAAKALMSELRELYRLIWQERGRLEPSANTAPGVKADITLDELQERYAAAMARQAEYEEISGEQRGDE